MIGSFSKWEQRTSHCLSASSFRVLLPFSMSSTICFLTKGKDQCEDKTFRAVCILINNPNWCISESSIVFYFLFLYGFYNVTEFHASIKTLTPNRKEQSHLFLQSWSNDGFDFWGFVIDLMWIYGKAQLFWSVCFFHML